MSTDRRDTDGTTRGRRRRGAALRLALSCAVSGTLLASGPTAQTEDSQPPEQRTPTMMFNDCLAQEKIGDACSCWQLYRKKYPAANAGEAAVSEMKVKECSAKAKPAEGPKQASLTYPARTAEDGKCYLGIKMEGAPSTILNELITKCGAPTGMIKMTPIMAGSQDSDDQQERFLIHLDSDECYRFFVAGDSGISALEVGFLDLENHLIAGDTEEDRMKVLPPRQAFCPKVSGVFKLVIAVTAGGGRYVLQGWKRPASLQMSTPGTGQRQASLAPE